MLEQALIELFEEQASENPPPPRVSVATVTSRGRSRRRRRRRAGLAAAPVFAAIAVLAIALAGVVPARTAGPAAVPARHAPSYFNPLRSHVWFGWLPDGMNGGNVVVGSGPLADQLSVTSKPLANPTSGPVNLWFYAVGACQDTGKHLVCGTTEELPQRLGRPIASVDGHAGYWVPQQPAPAKWGSLVWQWTDGGWAVLTAPDRQTALRVARSLRIGAGAGPVVEFPFQLTGLPADWRVDWVNAVPDKGVHYASMLDVAAGRVDDTPGFSTMLTPLFAETGLAHNGYDGSCHAPLANGWQPETIKGYPTYVRVRRLQSVLCTTDADGLYVQLTLGGHPVISVTNLFADHLRLLGPDPANWTTKPIG